MYINVNKFTHCFNSKKKNQPIFWLYLLRGSLDSFVNCNEKWMSLGRHLDVRQHYKDETSMTPSAYYYKTNATLPTNVISIPSETIRFFFLFLIKIKQLQLDELYGDPTVSIFDKKKLTNWRKTTTLIVTYSLEPKVILKVFLEEIIKVEFEKSDF